MRRYLILPLLLGTLLCNGTVYADPAATKPTSGRYTYYFRGESLKQTLITFAKSNNLLIKFDPTIRNEILRQPVMGRFSASSIENVLDGLAKQYGINWFTYSGTLYITSNTMVSKSIAVAPEDMPSLRYNLSTQGLLNLKFGYSELIAENKIIISGPELYVNMVLQQIKALNIAPLAQQFAVYHLKYASATDVKINLYNQVGLINPNNMQQFITIPGVATILQTLLQTQSETKTNTQLLNQIVEPIKNQANALIAQRNAQVSSETNPTENGGSNAGIVSAPIIQADPRLNTIIIRDKLSNLDIYKNLINLLDTPAPLIQVEVLMINLDQDALENKGINWWGATGGSTSAAGGFNTGNLSTSAANNLAMYFGGITPGQSLVTNVQNFMLSLQFLQKNGLAKTTSRPTIVTIDNIPAVMGFSQNMYLGATNANTSSGGAAAATSPSSAYQIQSSTALQITPHVIFAKNEQKQIKLTISLQDGSVEDQNLTALPMTTQGNINSQAVIKEGESLLLAGYTKTVQEKVTSQVPFLGSIPLLGWLFKSETVRNKQYMTFYLVTPHIVWSGLAQKDYIKVNNHVFDIKSDMPQNNFNPLKSR